MLAKPKADRRAPFVWVMSLSITSACASATVPPPVTPAEVSLSQDPSKPLDPAEAAAIAAAKNHPIALSYERPHAPALPVAPTRPSYADASPLNTGSAPVPQDQVIVVGQDQAPADGAITSAGGVTPAAEAAPPPADSVALASAPANTVSTVQDQGYVWTDGAWVAATPSVGVSVYGPDVWIGYSPWGWAYAPYYYHPYWPVAAPYPYYYHHHHHPYPPRYVQPLPHRPPPAYYGRTVAHDGHDHGSRGNPPRYYGPANQPAARRDVALPSGRDAAFRSAPSAPFVARGDSRGAPARSWSSAPRAAAPSAREASFQSAAAARRGGVSAPSSWSSAPRRAVPAPVAVSGGNQRPAAVSAPRSATFNRASSTSWGGSFGGGRRSVQISGGRR